MHAGNSFEQDDALGRKKYAEFIVDMIRNGAEYLQEDDTKSFSIAIDSAYGTGKTIFLRKLEALLEDHKYASESIDVIHYNAWEVDYTGDAFGAMKDAVLDEIPFKFEKWREKLKTMLKNLAGAAVDMVSLYNPRAGIAAKAVKDVIEAEEPQGRQLKRAMDAWQEAFSKAMEESGTLKLVVIIDELDRCRPDFAIQTLEIAKHLMNVKDVVFVYALDMQQLCSAVRAAYGDSIDANGYLCKMFNYVTKLPFPSVDGYVRAWVENGIKDINLKACFESRGLMEYFVKIATTLHATLRQIDVIMRTYIIMYRQFLCNYPEKEALELYLYFVFLKYVKAEWFDALFIGRGELEYHETHGKHGLKDIHTLYKKKSATIESVFDSEKIAVSSKGQTAMIGQRTDYGAIRNYHPLSDLNPCNLFSCLFNADLLRYEEIKHLTLAGYIHQNMEMFFYSLPDDSESTAADV